MTIVYRHYRNLSRPWLNTVCATHPSGRWWSLSPGCAPSSPSPVRPAGWCIPSPDSACCAPAGSICPAARARWPPAAAAACCSPSGFYGASSPPQTRPAAACWLPPADGDSNEKKVWRSVSSFIWLQCVLNPVTHKVSIQVLYFGKKRNRHSAVYNTQFSNPCLEESYIFLKYISVHIKTYSIKISDGWNIGYCNTLAVIL